MILHVNILLFEMRALCYGSLSAQCARHCLQRSVSETQFRKHVLFGIHVFIRLSLAGVVTRLWTFRTYWGKRISLL